MTLFTPVHSILEGRFSLFLQGTLKCVLATLAGAIAGSSVFILFFFFLFFLFFLFLSLLFFFLPVDLGRGLVETLATAGRPESSAASLPCDGLHKGTLNVKPLPLSFFRGIFPSLGYSL